MAEAARRERRDPEGAQPRRKGSDARPDDPSGHPSGLGPWAAPSAAALAASPALRLQQRLADEVVEERWSWRLTAAFVIGTCSAFWVTTYALLRLLIG